MSNVKDLTPVYDMIITALFAVGVVGVAAFVFAPRPPESLAEACDSDRVEVAAAIAEPGPECRDLALQESTTKKQ